MTTARIQDRTQGRWRSLLPALGISSQFLTGKHGPCPVCKDGKDRFRFDDKDGSGSYFCNTCGAGSGVDLVMRVTGTSFLEAKKLIDEQLPSTQIETARAVSKSPYDGEKIWGSCHKLTGLDPASKYLESRLLGRVPHLYPTQLRFHPRAKYIHADKSVTHHPAMIAKFLAPDATDCTLHTTFLDDGGNKASVPTVRKIAPRGIPKGGAVRLCNSGDTMGIAEGIETALSATALYDVPVWAALSAGCLVAWEPPETVKNIIVFGDADIKFGGQAAAYALAHRLTAKGFHVDVRIPDDAGDDWNDVLRGKQ
jgi:putative DNA primase/helicase